MFFIELRHVNDNSSLENIITKQHGLNEKTTDAKALRSILQGESGHKVLLLFDGYDEYTEGTNHDIDSAIENTLGDCFLLLTCRDGTEYIRSDIRNMFDGEIQVLGFDTRRQAQYIQKFFDSKTQVTEIFKQAGMSGIAELLNNPTILLMVLFHEGRRLPKSHTRIMSQIAAMCMDRSCMKHFGKKAKDIMGLEHILYRLGEVAWKALQRNNRQLLIHKVLYLNLSYVFFSYFLTQLIILLGNLALSSFNFLSQQVFHYSTSFIFNFLCNYSFKCKSTQSMSMGATESEQQQILKYFRMKY